MIQTLTTQHLSAEAIATLVEHLPDYVKVALAEKAAELECPIKAAISYCLCKRIVSCLDKYDR